MDKSSQEIPSHRKYNLVVIAWAAVVVLTFPGILFPVLFPAGLSRLFGIKETDMIGHSWLVIGWLLYVVLTVAACLARHRRTYFIIYTILCILLALNTIGCRVFWSELRGIQ